jgi:transposase, IS30 family
MPSGYPFSRTVRREFFDLVCQGMPVIRAERVVGVSFLTGSRWWREAGAMKLRVNSWGRGGLANPGHVSVPGGRGHRLSLDERIAIMRGVDAKLSYAEIGRRLGRDRSVVWREHQRNRNPDGDYHARMAHARAAQKACRPRQFKLVDNPLCASIEAWMDEGWSPKLIAELLARDHPDDRLCRVSHETIYQCLYVQTRGSLRADLHKCLSTKRAARKPRDRYTSRGVYSGQEFTISDRPPEADDRAVPGHWESQWCCQAA